MRVDRRELAEPLRKGDLLVLIQRLAAQQDDEVLVPGVEDAREIGVGHRLRRIDAADLRAERGRKPNDLHHLF